jgi:hypothetical protein
MLREAFGEHSQAVVFEWQSRFKAGQVSVEDDERSRRPSTTKLQKMLKKFENSLMKTITKQSLNPQTPLGLVMEFARRS